MSAWRDRRGEVWLLVAFVIFALAIGGHVWQRLENKHEGPASTSTRSAGMESIRSSVRQGTPRRTYADPNVIEERRRQLEDRRRQLVALLVQAAALATDDASVSAVANAPLAAMGRTPVPDNVEAFAAAIQDRFRNDFAPMAEGCYKELLVRQPRAQGEVVVRYEILADESMGGVVNTAELADESTLRDPIFDTCLRESFLSLDFDTLRSRGSINARFPFGFKDGRVDASHEIQLIDRRGPAPVRSIE